MCTKCSSPIHSSLGAYVLPSRNQAFHELCFQCRTCRKDLDVDDFVWVGDRFYHPNCVKCKTCEASLLMGQGGPVFLHKAAMFCKQHAYVAAKRKRCARCNGEILYESLVDSSENVSSGSGGKRAGCMLILLLLLPLLLLLLLLPLLGSRTTPRAFDVKCASAS